jgi:hypothetical protein
MGNHRFQVFSKMLGTRYLIKNMKIIHKTNHTLPQLNLDNHWENGIHSDHLGKKDCKENLWNEM